VRIRSLDELRQADERTLRFTSLGFDTGGMLRPEDAALYQQESLSRAELSEAVAEGTRSTFDRLRLLHSYGVLSYDMFTAADDLANLVIEQALRDRFIEFHNGTVPFHDAHGTVHNVPAASFQALYEEIHAEGRAGPRPPRAEGRVEADARAGGADRRAGRRRADAAADRRGDRGLDVHRPGRAGPGPAGRLGPGRRL
jgi:hypothetical protein